jgi:hypothetical protein
MVFWRIDELKRQLRRGPLPQRWAFGYVAITWVAWEILAGAPGAWSSSADPATIRDWVMYLTGVLIVAVGTYAAYRANGGSSGRDFAARFVALGFVVGLRILVLVITPVMVLFLVLTGAPGSRWSRIQDSEAFAWIQSIVLLALSYVTFAVRLVSHFRDVAAAADRPHAPAETAA